MSSRLVEFKCSTGTYINNNNNSNKIKRMHMLMIIISKTFKNYKHLFEIILLKV